MGKQVYTLTFFGLLLISLARLITDALPEFKGHVAPASPLLDAVTLFLVAVLFIRRPRGL